MDNKLKEGETLFADGKIDEAEELFLSEVEKDKNNKEAYNNLGVIAFEKEDVNRAVDYFTRALEIDHSYKDAILNYTALLRTLNQIHIAIPLLEKIIEIDPHDKDVSQLLKDATNNLKCLRNDKNAIRERTRNDKSIFLKHVPPELVNHKRGMNICVFADFNIAGNLTMLMRLINKYTIHKARCVIVNDDYLSYDKDVTLRPKGRKDLDPIAVAEAEQIVAQADFFHIGRSPVNFGNVDFKKILNKNNCVIQYFGSEYRAKGSQLFKMHTQTGIRGISWWDWTMLDHGLLFYHIDHVLDLERINPPISRAIDTIKIVHAPTNRIFKKTDFFLNVMQEIQKKHTNVELILLEGLENSECVRKKQEAHILFDQISVGMYALSALESLAMEQVVLCSLSNFGMSFCPESPVIPVHQENLYEVLDNLVTHPEKIIQLGKRGREYVKQKHSPERGIMQYTYLWDLIVNGLRLVDHKQNLFIKNSFENKELIELPIV